MNSATVSFNTTARQMAEMSQQKKKQTWGTSIVQPQQTNFET